MQQGIREAKLKGESEQIYQESSPELSSINICFYFSQIIEIFCLRRGWKMLINVHISLSSVRLISYQLFSAWVWEHSSLAVFSELLCSNTPDPHEETVLIQRTCGTQTSPTNHKCQDSLLKVSNKVQKTKCYSLYYPSLSYYHCKQEKKTLPTLLLTHKSYFWIMAAVSKARFSV